MAKHFINKTQAKTEVLLVSEGPMNETISLVTDLLCQGETLNGDPIKVNIHVAKYSIAPDSDIIVTRGGEVILRLTNSGELVFANAVLNINNEDDIVVTTNGATRGAFVILALSKISGFAPTIPNLGI